MRQICRMLGVLLFFACCGCGTMFNLNGEEPWLKGPPPKRPIAPFGGVDNDVRVLSRSNPLDDPCFTSAVVCDMAFSFVGDVLTLPWTSYQWLSSGGFHCSQVTWKIQAPGPMKSIILQHVPLGTPVQEARKFMEHEGFECTLRRNGTFCERDSDRREEHEGIDFLECRRVQSAGGLFVSRIWDVALVVKNDRVTDVLVSHWCDGP